MNLEDAKLFLGSWLIGEHLEDIKYFNEEDFNIKYASDKDKVFNLRTVFRAIKDGYKLVEIPNNLDLPIGELARWTSEYNEIFYENIMNGHKQTVTRDRINNALNEINNFEEAIEVIRLTVDNYKANKRQVEPVNLVESYSLSINERQSEDAAKWKGIPSLDRITNGIRRKDLIVISARTSVGKSAFGIQTAYTLTEQKKKVLYFTYEMPSEQILDRLLMRVREADSSKLKNWNVTQEEQTEYMRFVNHLQDEGLFKIFYNRNIKEVRTAIRNEKPFAVVIDQLSLLQSDKPSNSIREEYTHKTRELKAIAMEENVSVFLICQINREGAKKGEISLTDLKESGSIEEDADVVLLMRPRTEEEVDNPNIFELGITPIFVNVAKNRHGEKRAFDMVFVPRRMWFYEPYGE